jgi:hypothetical protein
MHIAAFAERVMSRIHFFEIEDKSWCPKSLRDGITDCIQFGLNLFNFYGPIYPQLKAAVFMSKNGGILDLGSGAGGPWPSLWKMLKKDEFALAILLSDKFPNIAAFEHLKTLTGGGISFYPESVDTLQIPPELNGFRTFFGAFHHFRPDEAKAILQSAVDSGSGIGLFEITGRNPMSLLLMAGLPMTAFLCSPFIKPFRISRLFWTYLVPALPVIGFFDGITSCLRTYSQKEMTALVDGLKPNRYHWIIGKKRTLLLAPISYLIGIPEKPGQRSSEEI